ncbi:hypothetical protein, partial [Shewanella sp.]|uniref:hypothetical protein n=1 Tax=Shewanella sp. TaxID=50422 RepID=UPI003F3B5784
TTVEFGEGDAKKSLTGSVAFLAMLEQQGVAVDFKEHSKDDKANSKSMSADELSRKAVNYQEEQRKAGRVIDIATAVNEISIQSE